MGWQGQLQEGDDVAGAIRNPADDPFTGRQPTGHERLTGLPWEADAVGGLAGHFRGDV